MAIPFIARAVATLARKAKLPTTGSAAKTVERVRQLKNLGAATDLKFIESQARRAITDQASNYRTGKQTGGVKVEVDPSARHRIDPWDVVTDIVSGKSAAQAARDALTSTLRLTINSRTAGGRSRPKVLEGEAALKKARALGEFVKELDRLRNFSTLGPRVRQSLAHKYGLTVDDVRGVVTDIHGFDVEFETVEKLARNRHTPNPARVVDPEHTADRHREQLASDLAGGQQLLTNLMSSLVNSGAMKASPRVANDVYNAVSKMTLTGMIAFFETGAMKNKYEYLSSDQNVVLGNLTKMVRSAGLDPAAYEYEELHF